MGLWKLKGSGDLGILKVLGIKPEFPQSNENRVVRMKLKKKWRRWFEQRIEGNEGWVMGTFEGRRCQREGISRGRSQKRKCVWMFEEGQGSWHRVNDARVISNEVKGWEWDSVLEYAIVRNHKDVGFYFGGNFLLKPTANKLPKSCHSHP